MNPLHAKPPEQFIADFFTTFTKAVVPGSEDASDLMSRYYTRDVVQVADGVPLDWDRLAAHLRPVRKNKRLMKAGFLWAFASPMPHPEPTPTTGTDARTETGTPSPSATC